MLSFRAPGFLLGLAPGAAVSVDLLPPGGCLEAGGTKAALGRTRGAPAARPVRHRAGEGARRLKKEGRRQVVVRLGFGFSFPLLYI